MTRRARSSRTSSKRHYLGSQGERQRRPGRLGRSGGQLRSTHRDGPLRVFEEYIPGEKVTATRFVDYWKMGEDGKALPYLDRRRGEDDCRRDGFVSRPQDRGRSWRIGSCLPAKLAPSLENDPNARAVPTAFSTQHLYFTFEHQRTTGDNVFGDVRARRALLLALDKGRAGSCRLRRVWESTVGPTSRLRKISHSARPASLRSGRTRKSPRGSLKRSV